jgi:hypothetical protein
MVLYSVPTKLAESQELGGALLHQRRVPLHVGNGTAVAKKAATIVKVFDEFEPAAVGIGESDEHSDR